MIRSWPNVDVAAVVLNAGKRNYSKALNNMASGHQSCKTYLSKLFKGFYWTTMRADP